MTFRIEIDPESTSATYGVNSANGYWITSKTCLDGQRAIITEILGTYVHLLIAQSHMPRREEKFQRYVAPYPKEQWVDIGEYVLYERAIESLAAAEENLSKIKREYQVVHIDRLNPDEPFKRIE